jgi:hypothetical protein
MLTVWYYAWIAPHVFLGTVLAAILRRGLQRQFPFFCSYVAFEIAQFLALLIAYLLPAVSRQEYHSFLFFGSSISTLLRFGIIYEITSEVLRSNSSLAAVLPAVLRWVAAVLLLAVAGASATLSAAGVDRARNAIHVLDFSASAVQAGLLVALFLLARFLHISWRSRAVGIALGFGIFASVELAATALRSEFGKTGSAAIDLATMGTYHVCVLVWLVYMLLPERSPQFVGRGLQKSDIEFWDQELQRIVRR